MTSIGWTWWTLNPLSSQQAVIRMLPISRRPLIKMMNYRWSLMTPNMLGLLVIMINRTPKSSINLNLSMLALSSTLMLKKRRRRLWELRKWTRATATSPFVISHLCLMSLFCWTWTQSTPHSSTKKWGSKMMKRLLLSSEGPGSQYSPQLAPSQWRNNITPQACHLTLTQILKIISDTMFDQRCVLKQYKA